MLDNQFIFKVEELYKEGYRMLDDSLYELDGENGKLPIFSEVLEGEMRTIKNPDYFRKKRWIYELMSRLERKVQEIATKIEVSESENKPSSIYEKEVIDDLEKFINIINQNLIDKNIIMPD